jgi:hypothetical protein
MMEGGCEVKRRLVSSQMLPSDCPDTLVSRPRVLKAAAFKRFSQMGQREGRGRGGLRTLGSGNYCTDSGRKSATAVASKREGALGTGQGPGEDGGGGGNQPRSFSRQARINRVGQTWYNYAVG